MLDDYRDSYNFVINNRDSWLRANVARFKNVAEHESSAKVMETEGLEGEKSGS